MLKPGWVRAAKSAFAAGGSWPALVLALGAALFLAPLGGAAYCRGLASLGAPDVSLPAMLAVLAAATVSSIAGFAFSALCGAMLLRGRAVAWRGAGRAGPVAGFLGGVTGGMAALPGPWVVIWCGMMGWDKARQRGVMQSYILSMQVLALVLLQFLGFSGPTGAAGDAAAWAYLPAALLGTAAGLYVFQRLTDQHFGRAVNLLLVVSGSALLL